MFTINATYKGQKELEAALEKYPERARQFFGPATLRSAKALANAVKSSQKTPLDTGTMINKTTAETRGDMNSAMVVATKYAAAVHEGISKDVDLGRRINIFIPGVGWRSINKIKARKGRPFVTWALQDGAQDQIDAIMGDAALQIIQ